jgi:hypothetical protein
MKNLTIVLLLAFMPTIASAQVLYGTLVGNVTDQTGAPIPNAKVEARNNGTGQLKSATTDDRGAYFFNDLQTGAYQVVISSPAFGKMQQENLRINANTTVRFDAAMSVAAVNESVTVADNGSVLKTDKADVSSQLSRQQVTELPSTAGRNFQNLYKTIPGFSPPLDAHSDAGNPQRSMVSNVNGVSYSNSNTKLDGAVISYPWLPHITAYIPPAEAIETVNIVTNSYDAEQGMAGGAVVNVQIKSGTNEFHGSGHWFHTNSAMKARPYFFFENRLPKNIFNQWGGTFGGPIKKNKLFFFANWERTTRRQYAFLFRTVPTEALKNGDFSGTGVNIYDPGTGNVNGTGRQLFPGNRIPLSSFDPASRTMLSLVPAPNQPGTVINNNYLATGTYAFNRDNADFKVNYNATDKSSLFVRYSYSPSDIFDPPSLGAAGGDALAGGQPGSAPGLIQTASVGGTYTISPRMLFDGNIGFTRQRLGAQNVDIDKNYGLDELRIPGTNGSDRLQGGYPRFNISGFSALGNPNVSNPFLFRDHQYTVTANLGYIKGAHSFRFGYDYQYLTINHFQPQAAFGPRGGFNFTGGLTALNGGTAPNLYNGLADFSLGLAQAMGKDVQYLNPATVRMPSHGFYARDQWQVNRKLTLNYGIRYEIYPFGTRDHTGFGRYDVATDRVIVGGLGNNPRNSGVDVGNGQFAPRFGAAYRLNDKTVIRAGFGISIDPNNFRQMRDAYPATISSQISGASTFQAAGTLRTGIPVVQGPDLSSPTLILPPTLQTTTYPTKIDRGYIRTYNVTIQREVGSGVNVQAGYVTSKSVRQFNNLNLNWSPPGGGNPGRQLFGTVGRIANINFFTPFKDSTYDSLQTTIVKRFAGSASNIGVAYTWSKSITYADNSENGLTFNVVSMWERNRAVANYDRPHNLAIYGNYELPFGKGRAHATSGVASKLLGGWQLNGVFTAISGSPFNVGSNGASLNAPGNTQTADQVKATVNKPKAVGRGASWFDPDAFAPVTAVRFGNTGRNILRGPGRVNLDASVFRNFRFKERVNIQFRAEAFNATNTPQFNNPGADASSPTRNPDGTIRALNNFTEVTGAVNERQLRLAMKFTF